MKAFIKAQCSSMAATVIDFMITIFLKEVCGLWYLFSTATGSVMGGVANFIMGRRWVFRAAGSSPGPQAIKYVLVWVGSILLNVSGMYLLTSIGRLNYVLSKVIVSLTVGICFNYVLQKTFVFKLNDDCQKTFIS